MFAENVIVNRPSHLVVEEHDPRDLRRFLPAGSRARVLAGARLCHFHFPGRLLCGRTEKSQAKLVDSTHPVLKS